jgi:Fur family ferric uptake transcriptional regulator
MRVILNLEDIMREYNTEQKKILTDFLRKNREKAYTIEEIAHELKELYGASAPGKSTVYRLIPHLVEEGQVSRLPRGRGRSFVYQSLEADRCHGHLHMRCMSCGRLIHLDDGLSEELLCKVRDLCGFSVNEKDSILLGNCLSCR